MIVALKNWPLFSKIAKNVATLFFIFAIFFATLRICEKTKF